MVLQLATIMVLLVSVLFGLQSESLASAQGRSPSSFPPQTRVWILSPNESYTESAIPLTINVRFYYGSAPASSEITVQNVVCKYSLDNSEWKNIPFIEVTANETWSHPLYQQMVHVVNCTYSTTLQDLSEGVHFIEVTVKSEVASDANASVYFTVAQQSEPFPTTLVVSTIAIVAIIVVALLVYFVSKRNPR